LLVELEGVESTGFEGAAFAGLSLSVALLALEPPEEL